MAVSVSYPGVYVQEVSSGVRTIVGVGTSIAMFIGRASSGALFQPVQCLSFEDVARTFGTDDGGSELISSLRMFFTNGGSNCYVMRIADQNAAAASLKLLTELKEPAQPALIVSALGAGPKGNDIRLSVNYNTTQPESTFNLEVFRWQRQSNGTQTRVGIERHNGLSMNPAHPRHAAYIVNRDSQLISVEDPLIAPSGDGYSLSGFAVSNSPVDSAVAQLAALFAKGARFGLSVGGGASTLIDLATINTPALPDVSSWEEAIRDAINTVLPADKHVKVAFVSGPVGTVGDPDNATLQLKISFTGGDVVITPAVTNDLAVLLMLGSAQGGIEVSPFGARRPAPNGVVSTLASLDDFGALPQSAFNALNINGSDVLLKDANALTTTTTTVAMPKPKMYQDKTATTYHDGHGGIGEKFAIIAAALVAKRAADPSFEWTAEVWGNRLALIPAGAAADASTAKVFAHIEGNANPILSALNTDAPATLAANVRYYALGNTSVGTHFAGGVAGTAGGAPAPLDYSKAYQVIDKEVDLFTLLVLPPDREHTEAQQRKLWGPASVFCQQRRAFLLIDPPGSWTSAQKATDVTVGVNTLRIGLVKDHSAVLFPRLKVDEGGKEVFVSPSGAIAGLISRIDSTRGVWKAAAGTEADLRGVIGVEQRFSDGENGVLNPKGVNTIRVFPNGIVNWGARTMDGDDDFGSEYKYIPIRRLALFMEESLYRGLKWAVFEPNDEPLWSQIRLNVGSFMHNLFRQGAFQGQTPRDAYFVKCDASTTTQSDRNLGIVNVMVGFAPLKPAEFIVLSLQQMAGQIET